jgi:hypothetical protein
MYAGSRNPWSACEIQDEKAIAREMFVQQAAHANADVSASPLRGARFAPPRVDGITLLNRQRTSSAKL